jgi:hypothetical protein
MDDKFLMTWIDDELEIVYRNEKFIRENSGAIVNRNHLGLQEICRYKNSLETLKKMVEHGVGN